MHDLDRTTLELGHDELEFGEFEGEGEGEFGFGELEGESPFNEAEAMELASELLSVTSEAELNYFLGDLIKKGVGAVKGVINSPVGRALGQALKPIAKAALPLAGGALGGLIGGPAGAALGGSLASKAGSLLGLELEGLSQEDREFETAKQFAHLAGATAAHAARAAAEHPHAHPHAIARHAVAKAAQTYAPGLLNKAPGAGATPPVPPAPAPPNLRRVGGGVQPPAPPAPRPAPPNLSGRPAPPDIHGLSGPGAGGGSQGATADGRWYRRGNRIIVVGA
jgi:hypothetical protein